MTSKTEISKAASILGSIKSPKKTAAARKYGKLGGRPKKKKDEPIHKEHSD